MPTLADNIATLAPHLEAVRAHGLLNHIDGQACPAVNGGWFETRAPEDNSLIARVARSGAEDVDLAASAAKAAFATWRQVPQTERKRILHAIADGIEARANEIALAECWDTGQTVRFMSKAALRGAANFRYFADLAPAAQDGQSLPTPNVMNLTTRVPIGPVGVITPWNTPFMLATWKIAPALAAGCTVVHKPAELSPWTARILIDIADAAGLPPGVWNLVNGTGDEAGRALTEHPDIRAIAFVGGGATGAAIMAQGAATMKRVHFELGGKNPIIVFDDADVETALDAVMFMAFSQNGERCTAASRLLVQSGIADTFEARLADRIAGLNVGHPLDPDTEIGPMIHASHRASILEHIAGGLRDGAHLATGSRPLAQGSCYVAPTLLTAVKHGMSVAQDEIFGPVLTSLRFETETEALQIANDTAYGLAAYVWTSDVTRSMRMTEALEAGMIWVNAVNVRHLGTPFGGMKGSGVGRDGGDWSFAFYMEDKHIGIATAAVEIPRLGLQ